jgi:hypothetical protein
MVKHAVLLSVVKQRLAVWWTKKPLYNDCKIKIMRLFGETKGKFAVFRTDGPAV